MAISGVAVGALYGVVAMCFVLIHKTSRVINFAQGESVLVGAWICWWLLAVCRLPFLLGFLATLLLMLAFGALVHALVLRPMLGKPATSAVMATIGLSTFLQALMKGTFGVFVQPFPNMLLGTSVSVLGVEIRTVYLFSLLASLLIMAALASFFAVTRVGLAMRATALDPQAAQSLGVPVQQMHALAWGISATVAAVAGIVV